MKHLTEEELISLYYGEPAGDASGHLEACADCRREFGALERWLGSVRIAEPPVKPESYGSEIWERIEWRLERAGPGQAGPERPAANWVTALMPPARIQPARWAFGAVAAAAILLVVLFVPPRRVQESAAVAPGARAFPAAVADHLDRSQLLLLQVANEDSADRGAGANSRFAEELARTNRLYRMSASQPGDAAVRSVLEELEWTLTELANEPGVSLESDRERLRDLIFKLRVLKRDLRRRSGEAPASEEEEL